MYLHKLIQTFMAFLLAEIGRNVSASRTWDAIKSEIYACRALHALGGISEMSPRVKFMNEMEFSDSGKWKIVFDVFFDFASNSCVEVKLNLCFSVCSDLFVWSFFLHNRLISIEVNVKLICDTFQVCWNQRNWPIPILNLTPECNQQIGRKFQTESNNPCRNKAHNCLHTDCVLSGSLTSSLVSSPTADFEANFQPDLENETNLHP